MDKPRMTRIQLYELADKMAKKAIEIFAKHDKKYAKEPLKNDDEIKLREMAEEVLRKYYLIEDED